MSLLEHYMNTDWDPDQASVGDEFMDSIVDSLCLSDDEDDDAGTGDASSLRDTIVIGATPQVSRWDATGTDDDAVGAIDDGGKCIPAAELEIIYQKRLHGDKVNRLQIAAQIRAHLNITPIVISDHPRG